MVLSMDDAATRADKYISPKPTSDHKADGMENLMSPTWYCLALTDTHVWKYLAHNAQRPYYVPASSPYEKAS